MKADAAKPLEIRRVEVAPALPLGPLCRQFRGEGARLGKQAF
jgi:hypothetical protein